MSLVSTLRHREPACSAEVTTDRLFEALRTVELWLDRSRQRRALREMPEHLTRDLALSQADIEAESRKPFWKA
jgi:uncharacterized protein YjiS (DUF1127 family)